MTITATRLDKHGIPQHLFYDGPAPLSFKTFHEWVVFLKDHDFTMEDLCEVDFHTEKEFYSPEELADILSCTRQTIYNQIRHGKIKKTQFCKKGAIEIPRSELERLQ
ncbi:hypothetical protein FACS189442_4520 [Spirochaetia bacterium]|nr:hypothetical protein FACS189442_4520 [Spirochaetia bacterium]